MANNQKMSHQHYQETQPSYLRRAQSTQNEEEETWNRELFEEWYVCDQHMRGYAPNQLTVNFVYELLLEPNLNPNAPGTSVEKFLVTGKLLKYEFGILKTTATELGLYACANAQTELYDPSIEVEGFDIIGIGSTGLDEPVDGSCQSSLATGRESDCVRIVGEMQAMYTGNAEKSQVQARVLELVESTMGNSRTRISPIEDALFLGDGTRVTAAGVVDVPEPTSLGGSSENSTIVVAASVVSGLALFVIVSALLVIRRKKRSSTEMKVILDCAAGESSIDEDDFYSLGSEGKGEKDGVMRTTSAPPLTYTSSSTTDPLLYVSSSPAPTLEDVEQPSSPPVADQDKKPEQFETTPAPMQPEPYSKPHPDFLDDDNHHQSIPSASSSASVEDSTSVTPQKDSVSHVPTVEQCSSPPDNSALSRGTQEQQHPLIDLLSLDDNDDDGDDIFAGMAVVTNDGSDDQGDEEGQRILLDLQGVPLEGMNNYFSRSTLKPNRKKRKKSFRAAATPRGSDVLVTLESIEEEETHLQEDHSEELQTAATFPMASNRSWFQPGRSPSPGMGEASPPKRVGQTITTPTKFPEPHQSGAVRSNSGSPPRSSSQLSSPMNNGSPGNSPPRPEIIIKERPGSMYTASTVPISSQILFEPGSRANSSTGTTQSLRNSPPDHSQLVAASPQRETKTFSARAPSPSRSSGRAPVTPQKGIKSGYFPSVEVSHYPDPNQGKHRSSAGFFLSQEASPASQPDDSGSSDDEEDEVGFSQSNSSESGSQEENGSSPDVVEKKSPQDSIPFGVELTAASSGSGSLPGQIMIRDRMSPMRTKDPDRTEAVFSPKNRSPPSLLDKNANSSDDEDDFDLLLAPEEQQMAALSAYPLSASKPKSISMPTSPNEKDGSTPSELTPNQFVFEEAMPPDAQLSAKLKRSSSNGLQAGSTPPEAEDSKAMGNDAEGSI
eukprot:CAMPEP_0172450762 /NCGR_PEP_ID=MMETSP1065-20121228/8985_1 /TAXON_ID=265537 /ORGANISM="Amphiprora paludosa, Strain CCMP125" /LENGTH=946 /DNA_ID=CAMNT_0013202583 /DNA_START=274 /DNA_END=3114 /DNA_ORIENTATION=+